MREIKFRAWDIEAKYWKPFSETMDYMMQPDEGHIYWEGVDITDRLEINQFTGLRDKNEKEIYEDDILKVQLPMGGFWGDVRQEKIGQVKYEADHGGFIVEWEYSKNQHHINLTCDVAIESEIIGNIHEIRN